MTQQRMPFFESAEDATRYAIAASGKAPKQIACALWPDKSPAAAHTALMNALNEGRSERLTFDQHLFIANFTGQYDVLRYAAHQCDHSQPVPQAPEEKAAQLQALLFQRAGELESVLASIKQLQARTAA
ncbi:MAG: hypothetical protein ACPHN2_08795 [Sinimarinibacterium flocculans]|uniref:hypothetical protein n=1 Tax=Sinimarinibacterium flocculans TaxID=985250 RepID=UPI003C5BE70E